MSVLERQAATSVTELKRRFDQAFAEAPPAGGPAQDDLLAIRVAEDPYAIRLHEVAELVSDRGITWLPGSVTELLGVVGLRQGIVPAYDFRALLGYPRADVPRWLAIAATARVAFAFDRFEGHLRVARAAVCAASADGAAQRPHVREVVRMDGSVRPVIHMASLLDQITVLVHQPPGRKGDDR